MRHYIRMTEKFVGVTEKSPFRLKVIGGQVDTACGFSQTRSAEPQRTVESRQQSVA
jgi:hypothetical protein